MKLCPVGSPPVLCWRIASLRSCSLGNFHCFSYFFLVWICQISVWQTKLLKQEKQLAGIGISLHRGAGLEDRHCLSIGHSKDWCIRGVKAGCRKERWTPAYFSFSHWAIALEGINEGRCDPICVCRELHQTWKQNWGGSEVPKSEGSGLWLGSVCNHCLVLELGFGVGCSSHLATT